MPESVLKLSLGAVLAMASLPGSATSPDASRWEGLSGRDLFLAVAADSRPTSPLGVSQTGGEGGIWAILEESETSDGAFRNRFSSERLAISDKADHVPTSATLFAIVIEDLWDPFSHWRTDSRTDLYNLWPSPPTAPQTRGIRLPGVVTNEKVFDNGLWAVGLGPLGATQFRCWEPPAGCHGEAARALLYMITVGSDGLLPWGEQPVPAYISSKSYPVLSDASARMLMNWLRQEPPSEAERRRNDIYGRAQGNRNPFVDFPELAEYLWGDHKGEAFHTEPSKPDNPDNPDQPDNAPLRALYTLADARINLHSPYVEDGAIWEVDGRAATLPYLIPAELGAGIHELRFTTPSGRQGKVRIRIAER